MFEFSTPKILTVTELTRSIKGLLESGFSFVTVSGEISNLRQPLSGHFYFTLKDEASQLKAVLFRQQQRYLAAMPADGLQVICRGRISVYEPRGDYQLIVDFIESRGAGALQLAFEELKRKLASEGLFNAEHKKRLPILPSRVALITSPDGAALFDFLKVAAARFAALPIEIFPVRVQGREAASEIIAALAALNDRRSSDIIVICRGGGSLEDLWPFNDERLARAIHASAVPVVTAIGHEVDFTIADFAADLRCPTPSAAAEQVIPHRQQLLQIIALHRQRTIKEILRKINEHRHIVQIQRGRLGDPRTMLTHFMLRLDYSQTTMLHGFVNLLSRYRAGVNQTVGRLHKQNPLQQLVLRKQWLAEQKRRLHAMIGLTLERRRARLNRTLSLLEAVGPLAVLKRGYSIVRALPGGEVIRASRQTKTGQALEVLLQKGRIECEVTKISE